MVFKKIKKKIIGFFVKTQLKQEAILRLALQEEGVDDKLLVIKIDHINGYNYVNNIKLPIIYPRSFFLKASKLNFEKKTDFYFNGNMSVSGERDKMLKPFSHYNSIIEESNFGREAKNKIVFNYDYFNGLASSKFGLCPHQKDFEGDNDTMWTYRFIESCMCKAIPLTFTETPLGKEFIQGFHCVNNESIEGVINDYSLDKVNENLELCKERFSFINNRYIDEIKCHLK